MIEKIKKALEDEERRQFWYIVAVFIGIVIVWILVLYYNNAIRSEVYRETSPDGKYTVVVTQIGQLSPIKEPKYEFALHYSDDLKGKAVIYRTDKGEVLYRYWVAPENIRWIDEGVEIFVADYGEEHIMDTLLYEQLESDE